MTTLKEKILGLPLPEPSIEAGTIYRSEWTEIDEAHFSADQMRDLLRAAAELVGNEGDVHPDDIAVDVFAADLKRTMKKGRDKGRSGWGDPKQCTVETLAQMMVAHIPKGDPMDIAAFSMMLHIRGLRLMEEHPCRYSDVVYAIKAAALAASAGEGEQKPFGYVVRTDPGNDGWTLFKGGTEDKAARMRQTYPTAHMIYTTNDSARIKHLTHERDMALAANRGEGRLREAAMTLVDTYFKNSVGENVYNRMAELRAALSAGKEEAS